MRPLLLGKQYAMKGFFLLFNPTSFAFFSLRLASNNTHAFEIFTTE
jgi:hypothetical protein